MSGELAVIAEVRGELIQGTKNVKLGLTPACGTRQIGREGNRIEIERWCQAYNGNRATRNQFYTSPGSPPSFDFTALKDEAAQGTAYELAALMLPEIQKPVTSVGCTAELGTLLCDASGFEPDGLTTNTTRWWVNNTAVPAWNDDQTAVSRACVPGSTVWVRAEITNTLGFLDSEQTTAFRCHGNRALNRPATADSSCSANEGAAKAVDGLVGGSTSNKWCSLGATNWWQVELGGTYRITSIVLRHAGAGGELSMWNTRDYTIQVSPNGVLWTTIVTVTGNTANVTTHQMTTVVNAFHVRVNITRPTSTFDNAARLYEVEVHV